jgi:hypothetical protein
VLNAGGCHTNPITPPLFLLLLFSPHYSPSLPITPLHSPLLPFTPLHSPSLPFTPLHSPSLPFTPLHSPSLPFTPLHSPLLPFTPHYSPSLPITPLLPSTCLRRSAHFKMARKYRKISPSTIVQKLEAQRQLYGSKLLELTPTQDEKAMQVLKLWTISDARTRSWARGRARTLLESIYNNEFLGVDVFLLCALSTSTTQLAIVDPGTCVSHIQKWWLTVEHPAGLSDTAKSFESRHWSVFSTFKRLVTFLSAIKDRILIRSTQPTSAYSCTSHITRTLQISRNKGLMSNSENDMPSVRSTATEHRLRHRWQKRKD